jgi:hypothetical protein
MYFMELNATVLLHFVLMTQTCPLAAPVKPAIFLFLEMSNLTSILSSSSSVSTYILRVLLLHGIEPNTQNIFTPWKIVVFETDAAHKFRLNSRRLSL